MESTINDSRYWLGRRPGYQGPRCALGFQGASVKWATGTSSDSEIPGLDGELLATGNNNRKYLQLRRAIRIATWNVRSLIQEGKLRLLGAELERNKVSVCGLSEVWWKGKGHFKTELGHLVIYSGNDDMARQGVAVWLNKEIAGSLIAYETINARIIKVKLSARPKDITLIQVYAPTTAASETEQEEFYGQLQAALNSISKRSTLILMGDFNAKVGEVTRELPNVGQYGLGERNEAGQTLVDFSVANDLAIMNTMFKQPLRRRYTWKSPNGLNRNQIDYIMTKTRWRHCITNCRTFPGADCDSDHNLVVATFRTRFRKARDMPAIARYDLEALKGPKGADFAVEVSNKFEALNLSEEENHPSEMWAQMKKVLKEAAESTIGKRQPVKKKSWISQSTLKLVEQKRIAKTQSKETYKKLKTEVQKAVRKDKQEYTENLCSKIQAESSTGKSRTVYNLVKSLSKTKFQPKLNTIQAADGQLITEPESIAKRWKEYSEELYSAEDTNIPTVPFDKEPPPLRSEVEKAINGIKVGRSAGPDDIPIELIQAGGSSVVNRMHQICCDVWETGVWPDDWGQSVFIPLLKKGDATECSNYRTISLVSHASKILLKIILGRIQAKTETEVADEQAGFRSGRGTRDQVTNLRILMAKLHEHKQPLYMCFIDFKKAFDSIQHERLWWTMLDMGYPPHLVNLLASLYKGQKACVRVAGVMSDWFKVNKGVRQGCILSPYLFNIVSEMVMREALENYDGGVLIGGRKINNLRYADDIVLLASSLTELQDLLNRVVTAGSKYNMHINAAKTKVMSLNKEPITVTVEGKVLEQVHEFTYLGSRITDDATCFKDLQVKLAVGLAVLQRFKQVWHGHSLTLPTKIKLCKTLVWSVVTYGSESWTLRKEEQRRLEAFEMKMLRKMLQIPWTAHKTNQSILEETGYKQNLLESIKKRKLAYIGHIARKSGENLEKTIMQGSVPGKRGRGRPRKAWLDDATEWTGLKVEGMMRATQDREKWRNIVQKAANP